MRVAHPCPRAVRQGAFVLALAAAVALLPMAPGGRAAVCFGLRAQPGAPRAGLVVDFGDGRAREFCVPLGAGKVTGLDLLLRSGLDVAYEDHGGGQVTVCRIAGEGCDFPSRPCFCRCADPSRDCRFWGYYLLEGGTWVFSEEGAGSRPVAGGAVQGWRFGEHEGGAGAPRVAGLEEICARAAAARPEGELLRALRPPSDQGWLVGAAFGAFAAVGAATLFVVRRRDRTGEAP